MIRRLALLGALVITGTACSGGSAPAAGDVPDPTASASRTTVVISSEVTTVEVAVPTTIVTVEMEEGTFVVSRPVGCDSEPGAPIDLDSEPTAWLVFGDYMRWEDQDGCPVRVDVISHIHGAEHCGFQQAEFISIGSPLGLSIASAENRRRFVWNGGGVIPGLAAGKIVDRSTLGPSVQDTGYRQGGSQLWLDSKDPPILYAATETGVKIFVLEPTAGLCE